MRLNRGLRFVAAILIWISVVLTALVATGTFSFESFFVLAFISYIAAVELVASNAIKIPFQNKLRLFYLFGLVALGGILVQRALETIPEGLLP
jgi:uncharacterized membrane protein